LRKELNPQKIIVIKSRYNLLVVLCFALEDGYIWSGLGFSLIMKPKTGDHYSTSKLKIQGPRENMV